MPLETVCSFKYLGRLLTATDDDWLEVINNIWKSSKSWSCLYGILGQEGGIPGRRGVFTL